MELLSIEIGKAAGRMGLMEKIGRPNLGTLSLRHLCDDQVEMLERMLDYKSLLFRSDIGMEI